MTAQPRRTSFLEAVTQASTGIPLGLGVSYAVAWFRLSPETTALLITNIMFVVSVARGYIIRRRFARRDEIIDQWHINVAEYKASLNQHGDLAG